MAIDKDPLPTDPRQSADAQPIGDRFELNLSGGPHGKPADAGDADGEDDPSESLGIHSGDEEEAADCSRVEGMPDAWLGNFAPQDGFGGDPSLDGTGSSSDEDDDAEVSVASSTVQIGTGQSGVLSLSDILDGASNQESVAANSSADVRPTAVDSQVADGHAALRSAAIESLDDEWGDIVADDRGTDGAESAGFGAFLTAAESADAIQAGDSFAGDSQGMEDSQGVVQDSAMTALPVPDEVSLRTGTPPPRKGGGLGQIAGILMGGVLAIPVTLAILIWGLQKDPFKLTRHVPQGVAFLLPAKFQIVPPLPAGRGTLDGLPAVAVPVIDQPHHDEVPAPVEPVASEGPASFALPENVAEEPSGTEPLPESVEVHDIDVGSVDDLLVTVEPPAIIADAHPAAIVEGLTSVSRRSDLTSLRLILDRTIEASRELQADAGGEGNSGRDRALVSWYRGVSDSALELVLAERAAADAGESPEEAVAMYGELPEWIAANEDGVAELESLGAMWLESGNRPSDGAVLVGRLEAVRRVGPYWGGRLVVSGDESRQVSFLARSEPDPAAGERVIMSGVLVDATTLWAADCRRLPRRAVPSGDGPE
ncbi:MAG: hypothetical protein DWH79_02080 [Planctomycetota bacterium]|nr:MAG: hypothetical protein DWH79_02080 [Planctomycetota bacterium]